MKKKAKDPDSYSIEDTAKICETTIWTIYSRIRQKKLKAYNVAGGRVLRVTKEALAEFLKENKLPYLDKIRELRSHKLLIVDDDAMIIRALVRHFSGMPNFEIRTASSGFQAGMEIQTFDPDVVILDIMLGDVNGKEIVRLLRDDPNRKHIKVIGISGFLADGEIQTLLDDGFDGFLIKPFRMGQLLEKIKQNL